MGPGLSSLLWRQRGAKQCELCPGDPARLSPWWCLFWGQARPHLEPRASWARWALSPPWSVLQRGCEQGADLRGPWDTLSCPLPALPFGPVSFPPQKYNADYDLSATQGADTLAFVSLLEEKLLPVLIHTFWVDAKNYVEHTRKWYAETIPFPLNFFLPNCMHKQHVERLQLMWGDGYMEDEEKLEKELYRDARECLTLLSQRLGSQKFFFGDSPASLDAFVFSRLAPLLKAKLPNGKLQQHLKSLQNLCNYCTSILSLYFPWDGGETHPQPHAGGDTEEDPHKRRNQLLSVLVGLVAMLGYAFLSGIVSIQRGAVGPAGRQPIALEEEEEEEEE
uniref:Metaxin-1 n=1 Tax=Anas platyrhynchos platyrhynchos TaxID=8840 RepID=U3IVF3_ANAPP